MPTSSASLSHRTRTRSASSKKGRERIQPQKSGCRLRERWQREASPKPVPIDEHTMVIFWLGIARRRIENRTTGSLRQTVVGLEARVESSLFGCRLSRGIASHQLCGNSASRSGSAGIRFDVRMQLLSRRTEKTSKLRRNCCATDQPESRWISTLKHKCRLNVPRDRRLSRWSGRPYSGLRLKRALQCSPKCSARKVLEMSYLLDLSGIPDGI